MASVWTWANADDQQSSEIPGTTSPIEKDWGTIDADDSAVIIDPSQCGTTETDRTNDNNMEEEVVATTHKDNPEVMITPSKLNEEAASESSVVVVTEPTQNDDMDVSCECDSDTQDITLDPALPNNQPTHRGCSSEVIMQVTGSLCSDNIRQSMYTNLVWLIAEIQAPKFSETHLSYDPNLCILDMPIVAVCSWDDIEIQRKGWRVLANLSGGPAAYATKLIRRGVWARAINVAADATIDMGVREDAIWTFANIIGEKTLAQDEYMPMMEYFCAKLPAATHLARSNNVKFALEYLRVWYGFAAMIKKQPTLETIEEYDIPWDEFVQWIDVPTTRTHEDMLAILMWMINSLTDKSNVVLDDFLQTDGLSRIVMVCHRSLLPLMSFGGDKYDALRGAISVFGNIASGTCDHAQILVQSGGLRVMWESMRNLEQILSMRMIQFSALTQCEKNAADELMYRISFALSNLTNDDSIRWDLLFDVFLGELVNLPLRLMRYISPGSNSWTETAHFVLSILVKCNDNKNCPDYLFFVENGIVLAEIVVDSLNAATSKRSFTISTFDILKCMNFMMRSGGFDSDTFGVLPYDQTIVEQLMIRGAPEAIAKVSCNNDAECEKLRDQLLEVFEQ